MAEMQSSVSLGGPRVVVRMPKSMRAMFWIVFWSMPVVADITVLSTRIPSAATGLVMSGLAWLVVLRGLHQQMVFSATCITVRNMFVTRVVESAQIAGGWFQCGGGILVVRLKDGSLTVFDVGDWRFGKRQKLRREEILAAVRDDVQATYGAKLRVDRPSLSPRRSPAHLWDMNPRFAPLLASEWAAILATIALVAFHILRSSG